MFVGHFAVGLAAKRLNPKIPLSLLFVAGQLLDFIWPLAVFMGLEKVAVNHSLPTFNALDLIHAPYSHSLGMSLIWGLLLGVGFKLLTKEKGALILVVLVVSHWFLDFITHIPDMPLWYGSEKFGLGLWQSKLATFFVEGSMFVLSIYWFVQTKVNFSRRRKWIFYSMIGLMSLIYVLSVFGPPPPETNSSVLIATPALAMWLFVLWAHYADKNS